MQIFCYIIFMFTFTPIPFLKYGFIELPTHGLLMAAAFLVGEILARREARRRGLSPDLVDNATVIAAVAGLIGARLVYVLVFGQQMSFVEMLSIWDGGLSSHGGYVFGVIAGLVYLKLKKCDLRAYADAVFPFLLIGWAIGRLGCFINWDSFGKVTSTFLSVVVYGEARYPTQLYEAFGYVAFFVILRFLLKPRLKMFGRPGVEAAAAAIFFSTTRIIVDFWRDELGTYMIVSRFVTIAVLIAAVIYILSALKRR